MKLKPTYIFLAIGLLVGAGITCLIFLYYQSTMHMPAVKVLRESDISSSTGYAFTDPLVTVSVTDTNSSQDIDMQNQINGYIQKEKQNGVSSVSVNFRDIDNSDGFNINPTELYDPASLTKIPLMMAYYALAENDPSVLSDQITYAGTDDLDATEQIPSPVQLTPGTSYTVEQLIEHMIQHSDNNAEQLLADRLVSVGQLNTLNTVFDELGISTSTQPDNTNVRSYSLFLRVLYNATYLDRDYSEKALQLLSQTDFSKGIDDGVPNDIIVAEKFGDARVPGITGTTVGVELQNCGIVYYPNHPYILCVMTKGDTIAHMETVIGGISGIVYQDIEKRYP